VTFSLASLEAQFRRCALLVTFYSVPAWLTLNKFSVLDPDIWWHIRTGQWIIQHRSVPYNDFFSTYGMGKSWFAYSWLFEVLIYGLFSRFGLIGLVIYVYTLMLGISAASYALVRKFEPRLAQSIILAAAAVLALVHMRTPRPWLFTILFFAIELNILVGVRRSRNYRRLFYLAPLFALWANLHIQFVYGLLVLGLAALDDPIDRLLRRQTPADAERDRPLPFDKMLIVIVTCLIATLVNPYHFRIYAVVLDTVRQSGLYQLISELSAMDFRSPWDWLVVGLTMGAVFALGRRRDLSSFWFLLLSVAVFLSFRSKRDVWFVTTVAIAIIALTRPVIKTRVEDRISKGQIAVVMVASIAMLGLAALTNRLSNPTLESFVARDYPVAAASFVEQRRLPGPLYNHFDWGGYLIWRLPGLPVSIDGRSNVHDATRIRHSAEVWGGRPNWASDPELAAARIVIAEKDFALTQLLRSDSRFEQVYEDQIAVVFIARNGSAKH
jgi:hypothetical protein